MVTQRKLDALRALAERPGTVAEGEAARLALARVLGKAPESTHVSDGFVGWESFRQFLIDKDTMAFVERLRKEYPPPRAWRECHYSPRKRRS